MVGRDENSDSMLWYQSAFGLGCGYLAAFARKTTAGPGRTGGEKHRPASLSNRAAPPLPKAALSRRTPNDVRAGRAVRAAVAREVTAGPSRTGSAEAPPSSVVQLRGFAPHFKSRISMNESIILEARELAFIDRVRPESSKIWHLADELFTEAVKAYYLAGVSFAKIRERLADAGVPEGDLPSQAAWVKFWSRFKPFLRLARRRAAAEGANASVEEARKSPVDFDEACLDLIHQLAFELLDSEAADPKEVSLLVRLLLKHKDQKLKERLVEVAERRAALAEQRQAGTTTTGGTGNGTAMDAEERERRIRQIFGITEWESKVQRPSEAEGMERRDGESGGREALGPELVAEGASNMQVRDKGDKLGGKLRLGLGLRLRHPNTRKTPKNTPEHPKRKDCTAGGVIFRGKIEAIVNLLRPDGWKAFGAFVQYAATRVLGGAGEPVTTLEV